VNLILKFLIGKVLEDPVTLAASNLSNGSKVMLMASQGLYQGVLFFILSFFVVVVEDKSVIFCCVCMMGC
jgi:uncharacterized membrane protein